MEVTVKVAFGHAVREGATVQSATVSLASDGSDSVHDLKSKTAAALGGSITAEDLLLSFGPNERKLGRQYVGDPTVDEKTLLLSSYTILAWLQRFPHWHLVARLLPPPPPAPGRRRVHGSAAGFGQPVPPPAPQMCPFPCLHTLCRNAGVAIQKAAATAEQGDPDSAVADARARGDIPKISDLPTPWGPKPYVPPPTEELIAAGYLPPQYPESSSPLVDC